LQVPDGVVEIGCSGLRGKRLRIRIEMFQQEQTERHNAG
jgi:hypothetical protein